MSNFTSSGTLPRKKRRRRFDLASRVDQDFREDSSTGARTRGLYCGSASRGGASRHTRGGGGFLGGPSLHILCAISENLARETCIASVDVGDTRQMHICKQANGQAYSETLMSLEHLQPHEIILNEGRKNSPLARKLMEQYEETDTVVKFVSRAFFDQAKGATLLEHVARNYDAASLEDFIILSSSYALLQYTQSCLGISLVKGSIQVYSSTGSNLLIIDRTTLAQLEVLINLKNGKGKQSLVGAIDHTKTQVGSRLLRTNLMFPPSQIATIEARLELVESFCNNEEFFYTTMEHLQALPGLEKMLTSLAHKPVSSKASSNLRLASRSIDAIISIKSVLEQLPKFAQDLESFLPDQIDDNQTRRTDRSSLYIGLGMSQAGTANSTHALLPQHLLRAIIENFLGPDLANLHAEIEKIIDPNIIFRRDSQGMRHQECFALKCDENDILHKWRQNFRQNVDEIYKKADHYAELHDIHVTVKYTTMRGYFLSVPDIVSTSLPDVFIHPSVCGKSIYCTTEEVSHLNQQASKDVQEILTTTHERIQGILDIGRQHYEQIASVVDAVAILDMCHSFADAVCLSKEPWCRPHLVDFDGAEQEENHEEFKRQDHGKDMMIIRGGRYCIDTKTAFPSTTDVFVPNDVVVTEKNRLTLITGINGSGKSTYLKQIGLLVILAQCGCYVPAEEATILIRTRLVSRIGSSDDQEHNISSFLMEMKETASLCQYSGAGTLVLIDELGRATSNEDGVAIAWSVAEHLLKTRCMAFFVTHYPQLTKLANIYGGVENTFLEATIDSNDKGGITYSHKVKVGSCKLMTDHGVRLAYHCGWHENLYDDAVKLQKLVAAGLPDEFTYEDENSCQNFEEANKVLGKLVSELANSDLLEDSPTRFAENLSVLQEHIAQQIKPDILLAMQQLLTDECGKGPYSSE